jgi:hypothetical protein
MRAVMETPTQSQPGAVRKLKVWEEGRGEGGVGGEGEGRGEERGEEEGVS